MITSAGALPCDKVIHTVGPRWISWESQEKCSLMEQRLHFFRKSELKLLYKQTNRFFFLHSLVCDFFVTAACCNKKVTNQEQVDGNLRISYIDALNKQRNGNAFLATTFGRRLDPQNRFFWLTKQQMNEPINVPSPEAITSVFAKAIENRVLLRLCGYRKKVAKSKNTNSMPITTQN